MDYALYELTSQVVKKIFLETFMSHNDSTSAIDDWKNNNICYDNKYLLSKMLFDNAMPLEKEIPIRVFDSKKDVDWEKAKNDAFTTLSWDDLKIGEVSKLEEIIENLISLSSQVETLSWLNKLFLDYNYNVLFICTLLHTLSHMEYDEVIPQGPTMAMASLSHKDERVVGYAIKAFANWNSKDTLNYMRTTEPAIKWVNKEWNRVIKYIEEFGDEGYELLNEND